MGRGGPGRVPHPRVRLDRQGPPAAGAVPRRPARRAAGVPDGDGGDRTAVRRARGRRGRSTGGRWTTPPTTGSASARWRGRRCLAAAPDGDVSVALGVAEVVTPDAVPAESRPLVKDLLVGWRGRASPRPARARPAPATGRLTWTPTCPTSGSRSAARRRTPSPRRCSPPAIPAVAKRLAQLVADAGAARLWVPAAKSRARGLRARRRPARAARPAGADRGHGRPGVHSTQAVGRAGARPAACQRRARRDQSSGGALAAGDARARRRGGRAVQPGHARARVVTPDGTLWMSLFRACAGWPSGVWIDGDRRTVPDGSSFAWQHWSHTFGYALASAGRGAATGARPGSARPPRTTTTT